MKNSPASTWRRGGWSARRRLAGLGLAAGLVLPAGCGSPPQVGPENYKLVSGLRTAISARRTDWLETTAQLASQKHATGEMSDEQFAAFESIIEAGRAGNWSDAESDVMRLAKAQHVTPEEAEQIRAKKPGRK